jgi:hypothetical protein
MTRDRKSRIVLVTGSSLCHNPRALKSATALARAGHAVSVLGAWHDAKFKARDLRLIETIPFRYVPTLDATLPDTAGEIGRWVRRAGKRTADLVYGATGWQSRLQLGFGIRRLLRASLDTDADLYIAHSEPALYVARALARRGRRVGVDMEDWFSEDLLPEARRHRPLRLLRSLERDLLSCGAFASCPSHAMSAALAGEYGCRPPTVIYNAFAWSERTALGGEVPAHDRRNRDVPSIHWYSTTLGPGRGLEDLVTALPLLASSAEIHLRGTPAAGFAEWINSRITPAWRGRLFLHPLVPNDRLLARVAEHDIGFAGEMNYCRSRDLTVTNKIMHYLLAGLATVASDTAGQHEVARAAPDAVQLYPSGDARALATVLDGLLGSRERMRRMRAAALRAAQDIFCWERQEPTLCRTVEAATGR